MDKISRRRFLSGVATGGVASLAGCVNPLSNDEDNEDNESGGDPSIEIITPEDGATVPLTFEIDVDVNNYNIRPLSEEEDYGHVVIVTNGDDISEGDEVPLSRGYKHLGQGSSSSQVELTIDGEYEIQAILSDKNNIATKYSDSITVQAQKEYDYINVFINSDENSAYQFRSVTPSRDKDLILPNDEIGSNNPDVTFVEGEDYKLYLGSTADSHPFEIQDAEGAPLLSMTNRGELENRDEIGWNMENGIIKFTATSELVEQADTYVCTSHPENMTGSIIQS